MQLLKTTQSLIAIIIFGGISLLPDQHTLAASITPFSIPVKPIRLYPEIGSKKINKIILTPTTTKKNTSVLPVATPTLNDYTLNIFCTETTKTYVKAVSGSGVFLNDPRDTQGVILTNAHVARHLLDVSKKCVGRTGSPAITTHTLTLRYIPSFWLNTHNQYVIGDPDQSSTGEFDFALIETTAIKPKKGSNSIYDVLKQNMILKFDNYNNTSFVGGTYIYSYPAQKTLSRNVYSPLFQKKDTVTVGDVYASPSHGEPSSLLDVKGSSQIDHGSSGGMVVSIGTHNNLIGLSSILIKDNQPQIVRVVTLRHIFSTLERDLSQINNAQTDSFLQLIQSSLRKQEDDFSFATILKNVKLTSVLEKYTRDTLINLHIIAR